MIRRLLYPCIHDFVVLRGILSRHYINYNISCPLLTLDLFNGVSEPWSVSWKSWIWYKKQLKTLTFVTSSNTLSYQQKVIIQTPSFRKLTTVVIGDVSSAPLGDLFSLTFGDFVVYVFFRSLFKRHGCVYIHIFRTFSINKMTYLFKLWIRISTNTNRTLSYIFYYHLFEAVHQFCKSLLICFFSLNWFTLMLFWFLFVDLSHVSLFDTTKGYSNTLPAHPERYTVTDTRYLVYIHVSTWCQKYQVRLHK